MALDFGSFHQQALISQTFNDKKNKSMLQLNSQWSVKRYRIRITQLLFGGPCGRRISASEDSIAETYGISLFDTVYKCNEQTDRRTDRHTIRLFAFIIYDEHTAHVMNKLPAGPKMLYHIDKFMTPVHDGTEKYSIKMCSSLSGVRILTHLKFFTQGHKTVLHWKSILN